MGFPKVVSGRGVHSAYGFLPKVSPGSPRGQRHLGKELLLGQGGLSGSLGPQPVPAGLGEVDRPVPGLGTWGWGSGGGELT